MTARNWIPPRAPSRVFGRLKLLPFINHGDPGGFGGWLVGTSGIAGQRAAQPKTTHAVLAIRYKAKTV